VRIWERGGQEKRKEGKKKGRLISYLTPFPIAIGNPPRRKVIKGGEKKKEERYFLSSSFLIHHHYFFLF